MTVVVRPVALADWAHLAALFGPSGAGGGCWCMFWRLPNKELAATEPADRQEALRTLVRSGEHTGLLAYVDGAPVGWCALAPRTDYRRLPSTVALKPDDPDDPSVWTLACFYVRRDQRRAGVATALLDAAVRYAGEQGAATLEAHPIADPIGRTASVLYTGTLELFLRAGFTPDARPQVGRYVLVRRAV